MKRDGLKMVIKGAGIGLVGCVLASLVLLCLMTTLVYNEVLPIDSVAAVCTVAAFIVTMTGVLVAHAATADQSVVLTLAVTVGLYLLCCVVTVLLLDSSFENVFPGVVASLGGAVAGMVVGKKHKKRGVHRRRKY